MTRLFSSLAILAVIAVATNAAFAAKPMIERAQFTSAILDREPVDEITHYDSSTGSVYFFTELLNFEGITATHRWIYNGEIKFELSFKIRGPRWRVYSQKTLPADWTGDWRVEVVNGDGTVLAGYNLVHSGT